MAAVKKIWASLEEKIEAHIERDPNSGCWIWAGTSTERAHPYYGVLGYGSVYWPPTKQNVLVHRFMWEKANGAKIPKGLVACHKCDTPPCCNPDHIFIGTMSENSKDAVKKRRVGLQLFRWGDHAARLKPNHYWRLCRRQKLPPGTVPGMISGPYEGKIIAIRHNYWPEG